MNSFYISFILASPPNQVYRNIIIIIIIIHIFHHFLGMSLLFSRNNIH